MMKIPIDTAIEPIIKILNSNGYKTISSCSGHSSIRFYELPQYLQELLLDFSKQDGGTLSQLTKKNHNPEGFIMFADKKTCSRAYKLFKRTPMKNRIYRQHNKIIRFRFKNQNQKQINQIWKNTYIKLNRLL